MVTQQGSDQAQFSVSARVAPRSTKPPSGDFSLSSALSGAPIKIQVCTGDVEIEHGLLQQQNPAELTICPRYLGSVTYNGLYTVEEEDFYSSGSQTTVEIWQRSAVAAESAHVKRLNLNRHPNYSHSLSRKRDIAQYGRKLSRNLSNHSLTCTYLRQSTMSILHNSPGTPPELTDSHSTTDSSVTSNTSAADDFSSSSMNFEDINLQDENHKTEEITRKGSRNGFVPYKNPSTTRRPALATIQTQQTSRNPSDRAIKSAALPPSKRNFTSPISAPGSSQKNSRSHSESPSLHKSRSVSRLGQFTQSPSSSLGVPGRRGSWQPARRTIYEIEAEYHDSDDELPDDASLFNVPMSPFAGGLRTASLSARSSARGSPERDGMSPAPIPLGHSRTTSERPPMDRAKSKALPRQRLTPRSSSNQLLKISKSTSPSPQGDLRFGRTRSWNLVMADLDHEARVIAEKLDFHHEAQAKADSSVTNSYRASAPGAIPLPPIQRGTLDFMPTSKEKEAVLSRTRPSWLPPKDPREEQRHLEEYKRMMKASLEADKKRQERMKQQHCTTDATRDSLQRVWAYYVDPTTDIATIDDRVDGLCWRGIPPKLRGAVWQRKVGNPLGMTLQDYRMALLKVKEIKSRPAERRSKQDSKMHKCFADIEKDAETAFPDISIFQRNGPQWQDLIDVCEAYAVCCSNPGYSYGIQLVAAMILLQIPTPSEALIFMANCLRKPVAAAFLAGETATKSRTYSKVKSTLEIKFPRLHAYLFSAEEEGGLSFTGEELFEPMFHTVFANGLDLDRLCRVWDIWVFESDRYLTRTAVAVLGSLQTQIFDVEGDVHLRKRNIQELLGWGPFERVNGGYWNLAASGNGDTFVESIRKAGKRDCVGE